MPVVVRIELVGGPHDGRCAELPPICPDCGKPLHDGQALEAPGGHRYVLEPTAIAYAPRRTALYRPAVRA